MNLSLNSLNSNSSKKIVYIDMDGVLVDYVEAYERYVKENNYSELDMGDFADIEGVFSNMHPMEGAVDAVKYLSEHYDVYLLSTSPWDNPSAAGDKINFVKEYFPWLAKKLILSHNKHLNRGHFLIDDRLHNGAGSFEEMNKDLNAKHIHYGVDVHNWDDVLKTL